MKKIIVNFIKSFALNIKTILFALAMAIVAWLAISFQLFPNVGRHINDIPVTANATAYMIDENLMIPEDFSDRIGIEIQGKRRDIGILTAEDFDVYLDLSEIKEAGEYLVNIIIEKDEKVKCDIVNAPLTQKINVIKITKKTLNLKATAENLQVTEGMQIDYANLTVNPPTVTISGEESLINSIERAEVRAVHDEELTASTEVKGELALYNSGGIKVQNPDILIENTNFTVSIPVFKQKTLPLEVSITNYPSNFNIEALKRKMRITPGELTISSPDNSIDYLNKLSIAEIPLHELDWKNLQDVITKIIELPDGYNNISGKNTARITFDDVEEYGTISIEVSSDNFTVINPPDGYEVKFQTEFITITVVGPSSVIHSMTSADISVIINLAGITDISEGAKQIGVNFKIAGTNVDAWVVGEYKIDMVINKNSN